MMIELRDGSRVSGTVVRVDNDNFEIDGQTVGFTSVTAFLDPAT